MCVDLFLDHVVLQLMQKTDILFKETHIGSDGICDTYILTDKDTKVEYIVVTTDTHFGHSCSITPRLKSNGELHINR